MRQGGGTVWTDLTLSQCLSNRVPPLRPSCYILVSCSNPQRGPSNGPACFSWRRCSALRRCDNVISWMLSWALSLGLHGACGGARGACHRREVHRVQELHQAEESNWRATTVSSVAQEHTRSPTWSRVILGGEARRAGAQVQ